MPLPGATQYEPPRRPIQAMGGLPCTLPQGILLLEPCTMVVLSSPQVIRPNIRMGFLGRQEPEDAQAEEGLSDTEEKEVWVLASPQKEESSPAMTGKKPAHSYQDNQPAQREPFNTTACVQPLTIGTQFFPMCYSARPQPDKWEQMSKDIEKLRRSSKETNETLRMLIGKLCEDRKSRRTILRSRSSRGRLPRPRQSQLPQPRLERVEEEAGLGNREYSGEAPDETHDPTDEVIQQLAELGELEMLARMQQVEFARWTDGTHTLFNRRGGNEASPDYEARIAIKARAHIITDIRAGNSPAAIFDRLSSHKRQAWFEEMTQTRPVLMGVNAMPLCMADRMAMVEDVRPPTMEQGRRYQAPQDRPTAHQTQETKGQALIVMDQYNGQDNTTAPHQEGALRTQSMQPPQLTEPQTERMK